MMRNLSVVPLAWTQCFDLTQHTSPYSATRPCPFSEEDKPLTSQHNATVHFTIPLTVLCCPHVSITPRTPAERRWGMHVDSPAAAVEKRLRQVLQVRAYSRGPRDSRCIWVPRLPSRFTRRVQSTLPQLAKGRASK